MKKKEAVIGVETLVDPLNLSVILAYLLKVKGMQIVISNIDYLYLQSIQGGDLPDDLGTLSIDSIIDYAWEQIERNNKLDTVRRAMNEKTNILSSEASFSMIHNLMERGYIELVDEKSGSITDGLCFLLTKDVDKGDTDPSHYFNKIANENGFLGDAFVWDTIEEICTPGYDHHKRDLNFVKEKYPHLPLDINESLADTFYGLRSHILHSRYQTVGISVRQNIPMVNSDSFFQERLQKCIGRRFPQVNKEINEAKENADIDFHKLAVRDIIAIIDGSDQAVKFVDALYRADEKFKKRRQGIEDFAVFLVNLGFGLVPYVGTAVSVLSYLYQKIREHIVFRKR